MQDLHRVYETNFTQYRSFVHLEEDLYREKKGEGVGWGILGETKVVLCKKHDEGKRLMMKLNMGLTETLEYLVNIPRIRSKASFCTIRCFPKSRSAVSLDAPLSRNAVRAIFPMKQYVDQRSGTITKNYGHSRTLSNI